MPVTATGPIFFNYKRQFFWAIQIKFLKILFSTTPYYTFADFVTYHVTCNIYNK